MTDKNYREFTGSGKSVLLMGGNWCKDCRIFLPEFESVVQNADFLGLGIRFGKIAVNSSREKQPEEISKIILPIYPTGFGRVPRIELFLDGCNILAYTETPDVKNLNREYLIKQLSTYYHVTFL